MAVHSLGIRQPPHSPGEKSLPTSPTCAQLATLSLQHSHHPHFFCRCVLARTHAPELPAPLGTPRLRSQCSSRSETSGQHCVQFADWRKNIGNAAEATTDPPVRQLLSSCNLVQASGHHHRYPHTCGSVSESESRQRIGRSCTKDNMAPRDSLLSPDMSLGRSLLAVEFSRLNI